MNDLPLLEVHINFVDTLQSILEETRVEGEYTNYINPFYLTQAQAESETARNLELHI